MTKKILTSMAAGAAMTMMMAGSVLAEDYKVGIIQFMDHASLNQIEAAIEKQLDAKSAEGEDKYIYEGYVFNGQGDQSNLSQITTQLISDGVDIIIPIATPAVFPVQEQTADSGLPVVFSAVSDPVTAGLVEDMNVPGANITGTSDALNTRAIFDLMFAADPEIKTVGLLYSKSEDSSTQPIEEAKAYLDEKGVSYVEGTGTTAGEVSQAVDSLIADDVDAIFTPTDNTVMNAELGIYEKLVEYGIPHYCGANSFALNGAFCGYGVDYMMLGTATADMAVEVLKGADPAEMPIRTFDSGIATINTETAEALGIDYSGFAELCTSVEEVVTEENFTEE